MRTAAGSQPRANDIDHSNEGFPFATAREIHVGYGTVLALRTTCVGELGWELYVPTEATTTVYGRSRRRGGAVALRHASCRASDSLRSEKAYRSWGQDIGRKDTPLEAGLDFAVAFDRRETFIGREALVRQRQVWLHRRLVTFTLDDPEPRLWCDESIYREGRLVGRLTWASYGYTLGCAVGMGYVQDDGEVRREFIESGTFELESAGERYRTTPHLASPYDPKGSRIRA